MNTKKLLFLLLTVSLLSCGRHAEIIEASEDILPTPVIEQYPLSINANINPEMRNASILILPTVSEMKGFSYEIPQEKFDAIFSGGAVDKSKVPQKIRNNLSNEEKLTLYSAQILATVPVRDQLYADAKKYKTKAYILGASLKNILISYPCFKVKAGENRGKCKIRPDETTKPEPKIASSCNSLQRSVNKFIELTDEVLTKFQSDVELCWSSGGNEIITLKKKLLAIKDQNEAAKGLGLDLLGVLERHSNIQLTAIPASSGVPGDEKSLISFSDGLTEIKDLTLQVDFFGEGYEEYSLQNNKIYNLRYYEDSPGIYILSFSLETSQFTMETELQRSYNSTQGVRFIGSGDFFYNSGINRKGFIRFDLDIK